MNHELPDVQAGFRNGRETRDQIANIFWIIKKAPWRHTKGSLSFPSHLVRNRTLAPQLEKTNKTPLSWRDEDLLFLHGLESNPESSLQTPQGA